MEKVEADNEELDDWVVCVAAVKVDKALPEDDKLNDTELDEKLLEGFMDILVDSIVLPVDDGDGGDETLLDEATDTLEVDELEVEEVVKDDVIEGELVGLDV
jgi:hypothetical protein